MNTEQNTNTAENGGSALNVQLAATINTSPEFDVYEDYDGGLHIIDGSQRMILSDVFAYDSGDSREERKSCAIKRMEAIAQMLNEGWNAVANAELSRVALAKSA